MNILKKLSKLSFIVLVLFLYSCKQEKQQIDVVKKTTEINKAINEIDLGLISSKKKLEDAKTNLNNTASFKLFRTSTTRNNQIKEAEKIVNLWQNKISELEHKKDSLENELINLKIYP